MEITLSPTFCPRSKEWTVQAYYGPEYAGSATTKSRAEAEKQARAAGAYYLRNRPAQGCLGGPAKVPATVPVMAMHGHLSEVRPRAEQAAGQRPPLQRFDQVSVTAMHGRLPAPGPAAEQAAGQRPPLQRFDQVSLMAMHGRLPAPGPAAEPVSVMAVAGALMP